MAPIEVKSKTPRLFIVRRPWYQATFPYGFWPTIINNRELAHKQFKGSVSGRWYFGGGVKKV
jgi:hypothetical protein